MKLQRKRGRKEVQNSLKTIKKMAVIIPYLSIVTLNVNGLIVQSKDIE